MIILGITGGVGSGKSRILNELSEKEGVYVIEADRLAHRLMEPGEEVYHAIVSEFGHEILDENLSVDRKKLGDIVFGNEEKLATLNSITHPIVKQNIQRIIDEKKKEGIRLLVIEAALLIQDGYKEICDEIWYIWADRETRIKRLASQRGYSLEKCISIFESQESDEYYERYTDFTINNDKSYENSSKQLNARLNILLNNDILNNI